MLVQGPALLLALAALLPAAAAAGASAELGPSTAAVAADDSCSSSSGTANSAACAVSALQREATGQRHTERNGHGAMASAGAGVGGAAGRRASLGRAAEEVLRTQAEKIAAIFNASAALPDDDPFWESAALAFKQVIYSGADGREWMDYCTAGDYESFNAKSCDPEGGGSSILNGVAADSWYCGRTEQMDWGSSGRPVADLCGAEVGSAYKPDGVCGSLSSKQLLYNLAFQGPGQWKEDPTTINVPSLDCLMGIVDCDIYYCHKCAGRCQA